jgi:hypothetical protein
LNLELVRDQSNVYGGKAHGTYFGDEGHMTLEAVAAAAADTDIALAAAGSSLANTYFYRMIELTF